MWILNKKNTIAINFSKEKCYHENKEKCKIICNSHEKFKNYSLFSCTNLIYNWL